MQVELAQDSCDMGFHAQSRPEPSDCAAVKGQIAEVDMPGNKGDHIGMEVVEAIATGCYGDPQLPGNHAILTM
eukprot:897877-Lingulodinium_polyedra.AAC.1